MVNFKMLGVEIILVALFCVMSIGFVVSYVVAVHNDHVSPYFPYISDTGSDPPESCIFTFVCSIGAILVLFITYIRHKHVHYDCQDTAARSVNCLNYLGTVCGVISVIGFLLVASFQDNKVLIVHYIGAMMVFGFGVLYEWIQLFISYKIYHSNLNMECYTKFILALRLVFSTIATVSLIGTFAIDRAIGNPVADKHFWTKDDPHYVGHVSSTACEWLMALTFLLYFLSFHMDFAKISIHVTIKSRQHTNSLIINERTPLQGVHI